MKKTEGKSQKAKVKRKKRVAPIAAIGAPQAQEVTPMSIPEFIRVLDSWLGTPFRHWASVKNRGADCVGFVIGVLIEARWIAPGRIRIPHYPADWHLHSEKSLILEALRAAPEFAEVPLDNLKTGDLVLFQFGKSASHIGFYIGGDYPLIYHEVYGRECMVTPYSQWVSRARFVFRVCSAAVPAASDPPRGEMDRSSAVPATCRPEASVTENGSAAVPAACRPEASVTEKTE